ncbi:MAG: hypothetical protein MUF09_06425 [Candidatus Nanopelagicales bacterium]|jgi:hypothetical protein|nr:hypothetical protein [Candidatus Nanopelagicales bacterium]
MSTSTAREETAHTPMARAATTYAQLTAHAADMLNRAGSRVRSPETDTSPTTAEDVAALHDLAAALAHLGQVLARPLGGSATTSPRRRRGGPDARLIRELAGVARPRDWAEPHPAGGPPADLAGAARMIRSAADLWATHHAADGRPRSPEASRMRHPATLGAACREWRALVTLTAEVADTLAADGSGSTLSESDLADLRRFPRPLRATGPAAGTGGLLDLTVARPGIRPGQLPLDELADRVGRLRHLAWTLAEVGSAPATVHGNMAAIGIAVHRAAARAHRSLAEQAGPDQTRDRHRDAAARAAAGEARWRAVAEQVRALRTPHPSTHPIQIERLDIDRLLRRAAPPGVPLSRPEVGWALSRIAESFATIAALNATALSAAHDRGDLLLLGRAIPTEALGRRPDLLAARLTDQVIPAPSAVITSLLATYRTLAREARPRRAPDTQRRGDAAPPAA